MIASFGDAALLLPASVGVLAVLLLTQAWRNAIAWSAAISTCLVVTLVGKLALQTCSTEIDLLARSRFVSPSGHVAFSTAFYVGVATIVGLGRPTAYRFFLLIPALLLVSLIGLSRVYHGAHTPEEVVAGGLIGLASLLVLRSLLDHTPLRLTIPHRLLIIGALLVFAVLKGRELNAEPVIRDLAQQLGASARLCSATPTNANAWLGHGDSGPRWSEEGSGRG